MNLENSPNRLDLVVLLESLGNAAHLVEDEGTLNLDESKFLLEFLVGHTLFGKRVTAFL